MAIEKPTNKTANKKKRVGEASKVKASTRKPARSKKPVSKASEKVARVKPKTVKNPLASDLARILRRHVEPILVLDADKLAVFVNRSALKLLGQQKADVIGWVQDIEDEGFEICDADFSWREEPAILLKGKSKLETAQQPEESPELKSDNKLLRKHLARSKMKLTLLEEKYQKLEDLQDEAELEQSAASGQLEREIKARATLEDEAERNIQFLTKKAKGRESELQSRSEELERFLEDLESEGEDRSDEIEALKKTCQELERGKKEAESRADELEVFLEEAEAQGSESDQKLQESKTQATATQEKISKLQSLLGQADNAALKLKTTEDDLKIANYDLNEVREKLATSQARAQSAEERANQAAEELCRAWAETETSQKGFDKARERMDELEELMKKFTPKEDDTIMGFL